MRALLLTHGTIHFTNSYPIPTPVPGEALIHVLHAGICHTDLELLRGYRGFNGVPGHEFVGQVEACANRPDLVGRRVVGEINISCGTCTRCRMNMRTHCQQRRVLGIDGKDGAFAEYLTLPVENLHLVPDSISDSEAVFVEPTAACLEILEQVQIQPTDSILVLGDGKLGLLAAQVLALTSAQVKIQGRHAQKLAIARSMGLETALAEENTDNQAQASFDIVVECTGSVSGLETACRMVRPRGTIILKSTVASKAALDLAPFVVNEITIVGSRCGPFAPAIRALAQQRVHVTPLLSATYPLHAGEEAFEAATRHEMLKVQISTYNDT
jgi:threonine dehydrogenase-like Zn-dependent dehydrogenase